MGGATGEVSPIEADAAKRDAFYDAFRFSISNRR
jgi:hypothetical protein